MIRCSRLAFLFEVDAADLTGNLFTVGGNTVSAASTTSYPTALAYLHGRGSQTGRSLGEEFDAVGTGAGSWEVGVDPELDKMYIRYEGGGGTGAFTVEVLAGDDATAFGMGPVGTVLNSVDLGGGIHQVTATYRPTPGVITNAHLEITPVDGAAFQVPSVGYRAQSVWTLLRRVSGGGTPDLDQLNPADSLAYRMALAIDGLQQRVGAGLTDDGRSWISWDNSLSGVQISWVNDWLRQLLGYRGDEIAEAHVGPVGTVRIIESTSPNLWAVVTNRAMRIGLDLIHGEEGEIHRLWDGALVGATWATWKAARIPFYLQGPNETLDLHRHWVGDRDNPGVLQLAPRGSYVEVCPRWGDTRRAHGSAAPVYNGAWTRPPYSTLWTAAGNGLVGRWICRRSGTDEAEKSVILDRRMRRLEASLTVELAEADAYVP